MTLDRQATASRIARRVRSQRAALSLTQGEVATRSGLNRSYISQIERGAQIPSAWAILRLAGALETTAGDLLD